MYRMNNYSGCTPRDRLNPRVFAEENEQTCMANSVTEAEEERPLLAEPLAMFYFPEQMWQNLYSEEEGLCRGTIFKELDKPFYGPKCGGGCRE